jgi:seryl-tRNA synthetase
MHDIKALRLDPEAYDRAWRARGLDAQTPRILGVDAALRAAQTALQTAQSRRNEVSKLIGRARLYRTPPGRGGEP